MVKKWNYHWHLLEELSRALAQKEYPLMQKKYLANMLEEYAKKVSAEAVKLCEYANRETVSAEDIKLAAKRL